MYVSIFVCVGESEWVVMHVFLPQTFAFWILRNSHGDSNTYTTPHQPSNLVLILYLAILLLFLPHSNSFEVRFNTILICYGPKCITEKEVFYSFAFLQEKLMCIGKVELNQWMRAILNISLSWLLWSLYVLQLDLDLCNELYFSAFHHEI